jgi:hypothetical protein
LKEINTNKTLETLEKQVWPSLNETDQESYLITECNRLRKIPLKDFETEDFRILIGQDIGLKFLIPLAIDILRKDILAEGDNYPGDLLANILRSDKQFWKEDKSQWKSVCELYESNKDRIKSSDLIWDIKKDLKEYYMNFKEIN